MPRKEHHSTPIIIGRFLYTHSAAVPLDTSAWFAWLELHSTFYFDSPLGSFTARCEQRADALFWYAFRRYHKRLYKAYLGRSSTQLCALAQRCPALGRQSWRLIAPANLKREECDGPPSDRRPPTLARLACSQTGMEAPGLR